MNKYKEYNILWVDDEPRSIMPFKDAIVDILEDAVNVNFILASTLDQAGLVLSANKIDLIISDLLLPPCGDCPDNSSHNQYAGIRLFHNLRKNQYGTVNASVPVIFFSVSSDYSLRFEIEKEFYQDVRKVFFCSKFYSDFADLSEMVLSCLEN